MRPGGIIDHGEGSMSVLCKLLSLPKRLFRSERSRCKDGSLQASLSSASFRGVHGCGTAVEVVNVPFSLAVPGWS